MLPAESVTVTVKLYSPLAVGVPPITPLALSRLNPEGIVPDNTENVSGAVPPLTATVWL